MSCRLFVHALLATGLIAMHPAIVGSQRASLPVFPGAEGFGSTTPAGRGGTVYRVTTLDDSGPGSLRAALETREPRVVLFEISGIIDLEGPITIRTPFITIAGQTSPSPGITLRGAPLRIATHDVLIQHLRIRIGGAAKVQDADALSVMHGSHDVVIDHNSLSWAVDENFSAYGRDITFSNNIISEALSKSVHSKGEHSKGSLAGDGTDRIAFLRNLFAHNLERNPQLSGDVRVLLVNNINYNPGNAKGAVYFSNGYEVPHPTIASLVGNVMIPGPDTPRSVNVIWLRSSAAEGSQVYVEDNEGPRRSGDPWSVVRNDAGHRAVAEAPPVWVSPLTVLPSAEVLEHVLANAGARPVDRDTVDIRVADSVSRRSGDIIDTPYQVGGWPTLPVNRRPLTLPENPAGDSDGDGYTNLEEWLHSQADNVETVPLR